MTQVLIDQLSHSEVLPDWIIEEDVLYLKSRWQEHPSWQFRWIPREANDLAHELEHWCRRMDVVGAIDVSRIPLILSPGTLMVKVSVA